MSTLYKFELIKILKNKVAIVTFLVLFVYAFIQGEFEVRGNVNDLVKWEAYKTLNGREIDDALISELKSVTDETGRIINEQDAAYEDLTYRVQDVLGFGVSFKDMDADTLYETRNETIKEAYELSHLTSEEEAYWQEKESEIDKPFIYHDTVITAAMLEGTSNYMILMLVVIATALSAVFAMETQRKTDPMIRASLYGNKKLYLVKVLAGMTYVLVAFMILIICFYAYTYLRWGFDGLEASIQIYRPFAQLGLSVWQLVGILFMLLVFGSILVSAFALFISNLTRNGLATMAIIIGTHLTLFALGAMIPTSMRPLSQFLSLMPATLVSSRLVYEFRLVQLGRFFLCYQFAPVLYLALTAILLIAGYVLYSRYEIKSN